MGGEVHTRRKGLTDQNLLAVHLFPKNPAVFFEYPVINHPMYNRSKRNEN